MHDYSILFLFFFFHRWFKLIQRQVERRIGEGAIIINTHISKALHPRMADKRTDLIQDRGDIVAGR